MGQLIVIEAIDAGGSQTQTDRLKKRLQAAGCQVTPLHFPQEDRATGQLIYEKFLHQDGQRPFTRREQALLYVQDFFSRAEDMWQVVNSKSDQAILLLDRYYTSTLAYQTIHLAGNNRRQMIEWLEWLTLQHTPALPAPNLVILIDTPVELSLRRLAGRKKDFFEAGAKLTAIRSSYLKLAKEYKWPIVEGVDSKGQERTRADIHQEIWKLTSSLL